jgi:asparagine synthase (glutamine-hydrolysing)
MCGIAGEFRFDGRAPERARLEKMVAKLARRGPDGEGLHLAGPVALGHRRLAIIDLSERSRQPMLDAELGLALVFNGTIYNYPQLRAELIGKGHSFQSDGDTEVILRAYTEWGERLCGAPARRLRLCTLGCAKPKSAAGARPARHQAALHHSRMPAASASLQRRKALLAGADADNPVDTAIDPIALHHHLTLHAVVPAPRTLLGGIAQAEPASFAAHRRARPSARAALLAPDRHPAGQAPEGSEWRVAIHDACGRRCANAC